jgi:thiamine-phosphate pyrophosphorylase
MSIRCLITDGTASHNESKWLDHAAAWIADGIELLQIRERNLPVRQLAGLTRKVLSLPNPHGTKILINDRADVAIACGAHGVHLRDGSVPPEIFARPGFFVSIACHNIADLERTRGADFILLAPIFKPLSKEDTRPVLGIEAIGEITRISPIPVLALGGINAVNARLCVEAGAAGVAGISYFNGLPHRSVRPFSLL